MFKKKDPDHAVLKRQLLDGIEVLEALGIPYHLEGGTLLGIVRDGDILPWDHDTDISIMRADVGRVPEIEEALKKRGWRVSVRRYTGARAYAKDGDIRLIKIKGHRLWLLPDQHMLDIFVKTPFEGHVYWQAEGCIMRVPEHHYQGVETVSWQGKQVSAPKDFDGYLTAKYGDWRVPVKEWSAKMEKTIVDRLPD